MQLVLLKPVLVSSMREEARGKSRLTRKRKSRYNACEESKMKLPPEHFLLNVIPD